MALVVVALVLLGAIGFWTRRLNLVTSGPGRINAMATVALRRVGEGLMLLSATGCLVLLAALAS